jgi:hypothetical protein
MTQDNHIINHEVFSTGAFAFVLIGISLLVGSWTILALVSVRTILNHYRVLEEKYALAEQYG